MRGDKIIVFSDNIFALREYAQRLRRPFIFGGTSHAERTRVLAAFKRNPEVHFPFSPPLMHLTTTLTTAGSLIDRSSQKDHS